MPRAGGLPWRRWICTSPAPLKKKSANVDGYWTLSSVEQACQPHVGVHRLALCRYDDGRARTANQQGARVTGNDGLLERLIASEVFGRLACEVLLDDGCQSRSVRSSPVRDVRVGVTVERMNQRQPACQVFGE